MNALQLLRTGLLWVRSILLIFFVITIGSVLVLRWIPPPTTSVVLQRQVVTLLSGEDPRKIRYGWTPMRRISPHAALAVIAAEDQNFPYHGGFDFDSIQDALAKRRRHGRVRGASTITQQVAKNVFLWSERSWVRKGLEAYFTLLIENLWPKRRILEVYLNAAEFGPGVYGVGPASRRYFEREPARLTLEQASLLAAVLPNPKRLRVDRPSGYVRGRAAWIRSQCRQLGGVEYLEALR